MRVRVMLRYINGGQPKPKWRQAFEPTWDAEGILSLKVERVKILGDYAYMKVARLRPISGEGELLDPIYRAEMITEQQHVRVDGLQHDELFNRWTAQAWAGQLMTDQGPEPK